MQVKKPVAVILLFLFASILPMPFHEESSMRNEAKASETEPKVLLLIRTGVSEYTGLMLNKEVGVMMSMLEKAGFRVIVASVSGEPIESAYAKLIPDLAFNAVEVNEYVGIIMPCMAKGSETWHASPEEISIVKEAFSQGKPIAAQRGSIITLAEAGLLKGKKYAFSDDRQGQKASFADAIYGGKGVIQDGKIITSSTCPYAAVYYGEDDTTSELTRLFIETIKE